MSKYRKFFLAAELVYIIVLILVVVGQLGIELKSMVLLLCLLLFSLVAREDIKSEMVGWKGLFLGILASVFYFFLVNGIDERKILMTILSAVSLPLLTALISREKGMGYGDPLLALWGGLLCAYPLSIFMIVFAYLAGAIFGIIILKLNTEVKQLPFAPFLLFGILLSLAFSDSLSGWFSNLL